jgi:hypothetical protein
VGSSNIIHSTLYRVAYWRQVPTIKYMNRFQQHAASCAAELHVRSLARLVMLCMLHLLAP